MGLHYSIYPNKKTNCENNFSNGLSFFFEQVGGYGETAEVEQVSKILNIDLFAFQDVEYDAENPKDVEKSWKNIDSFSAIVDTFITRIENNPDYYKKVVHNPDKEKQDDKHAEILQIKDTAMALKFMEDLQKEPLYMYPPDYGYLSEGRLLKDLKILKKTLNCFKQDGVTKIRLEYS